MSEKIKDKQTGLSKSKYCCGIQCPKILWLDKHKPEEKISTLSESVIENGNRVGALAREYFGDYALVEFNHEDMNQMVIKTQEYIAAGKENIAEASFYTDGLFCSVDILHKNGNSWEIYEVKSTTKLHEQFLDDMAFQCYVLEKCDLEISKVFNMHINGNYVFQKELNIKEYFTIEDCTEICKSKHHEIEQNIALIREYMSVEDEPAKDIGIHCEKPYECGYKAYCGRNILRPSVFDIHGLRKSSMYKLYQDGIISFEDVINNKIKLNDKELCQVETAYYHKQDTVNKEEIRKFLNTLSYPIYHLDFETFMNVIPEWDGCTPYGQIPFQYSLHIEAEDGKLEHMEFLASAGKDPRRAVAEQLCKDIPLDVCLLAYNMSFEKNVLEMLALLYPDLATHLRNIKENFKDLEDPFRNKYYYSEKMQGSYSIKYVLPALFPDDASLDYHNLEQVHKGDEASAAFLKLDKLPKEEAEELRNNMLKYCGLDTYAMVKILGKLKEAVR